MSTMKIKIKPWIVPSFVSAEMPPGKREDGFHPDSVPKWKLSELDAETLDAQCREFRAEVFRKAGKKDPQYA